MAISTDVALPQITPARCQELLDDLVELYALERLTCAVHGERDTFVVSAPRGGTRTDLRPLPVGCLAKLYTARLAAQVFAQRRISLDVPLTELCPQFRVASQEATRTITLRHLLTHSSGLDSEGLTGFVVREREFWQLVRDVRQLFWPGEERSYCSLGFLLAGRVAEIISGKSWWDLLAESVAGATQWLPNESPGCRPLINAAAIAPQATSGAISGTAAFGYGLALTARELARFGAMHLSGPARAADLFAWWPDGEGAFCAGGTADVGETSEVDTRLQLVPAARVSIAAVAEGPISGAVHDFFRQLLGSKWDGFVQPRRRVDPEAMLACVLGRRFRCAVLDISFRRRGLDTIADMWVGRDGVDTWVGRARVFQSVVVHVGQAGYLAGAFCTQNVTFDFVLEPLDYQGDIQYLIFNRKMLIRQAGSAEP